MTSQNETDERRLDSLLDYLRTDSRLAAERATAVRRAAHDQTCELLLLQAYVHISQLMITRGTPLTVPAQFGFKSLLRKAWRTRRAEIRALVPIFEETSLRLH